MKGDSVRRFVEGDFAGWIKDANMDGRTVRALINLSSVGSGCRFHLWEFDEHIDILKVSIYKSLSSNRT